MSATVSNTLTDTTGVGVSGVTVRAHLKAASGFSADGTEETITYAEAVTDDTGAWSLNLTSTGDYEDTGAYYELIEGRRVWAIGVPASGAVTLRSQIIDTIPTSVPLNAGLSVLTGSGPPAPSLGVDTQAYIDTTGANLYRKVGGSWGTPTSLAGSLSIATADGRYASIAADGLKVAKASVPANAVENSVDNTGATDCSSSLQAFLNSVTGDQVARLYGTFKHGSTIVFKGNVDASGALFNFTGTGVAVQVGDGTSGGNIVRANVQLPRIVNTTKPASTWTAGTVGCKVINASACLVTVPHIQNFETGLLVYGDGEGTSYSIFTLGHVDNNKVNLLLDGINSGWVNQNVFIGGRFSHTTAQGTGGVGGTRQIAFALIGAGGGPNNNSWYTPSLESANVVEYMIEVLGGTNNVWDNPRFEDPGGTPKIHWGAAAISNRVRNGYNASNVVEVHESGSNRNDVYFQSFERHTSPFVLENTAANTAAQITGMATGATVAGTSITTGYVYNVTANLWSFKAAADGHDKIRIDPVLGKVLVGAGTANPFLGLTPNGHIFPVFTTTNRNALTPLAGQTVFDSTLHYLVTYDGSVWRNGAGTSV